VIPDPRCRLIFGGGPISLITTTKTQTNGSLQGIRRPIQVFDECREDPDRSARQLVRIQDREVVRLCVVPRRVIDLNAILEAEIPVTSSKRTTSSMSLRAMNVCCRKALRP